VAGRTRQPVSVRVTSAAIAYLDDQCGPGKDFPDRGHVADWCIREIRRKRFVRLREQENARGLPAAAEGRHQISMTLAKDEVAWIDSLAGPSRQPFQTRAEGISWCLETAFQRRLKPSRREILAEASAATR
jgi:hypothetical protein